MIPQKDGQRPIAPFAVSGKFIEMVVIRIIRPLPKSEAEHGRHQRERQIIERAPLPARGVTQKKGQQQDDK